MGLVDYSDSDASEAEETSVLKPAPSSSKPTFQKIVDRSNPSKIKVALPATKLPEDDKSDEPPIKRAKTTGGAFSGFNTFLPAPKRTGQSTNATLESGAGTKRGGLGAGVSLKTGAAPAFSREREPERDYPEDLDGEEREQMSSHSSGGLKSPPQKVAPVDWQKPAEEVKLVGKPLLFKPLSVARKPAKKKKQDPTTATLATSSPAAPSIPQPRSAPPAARPKVSLFSISTEEANVTLPTSTGDYKPMMYEPATGRAGDHGEGNEFEPSYEDHTPTTSHNTLPPAPTPPTSESLDDIAGDLNLSAAERRQLFGRQKGGKTGGIRIAKKIINFNTDQEYLHNEELRAAGQQPVHNPVRALAPGKHSLKQLVNAVQSQKDALEESFAKGKNNRAEANSRYGFGR